MQACMHAIVVGEIREVLGRQLRGLALPFESETEIAPGSFEKFSRGSVKTTGEALLSINHDSGRVLAREPDSLRFEERNDGLYLTAELPETSEGNDVLALIRARTYRSLSIEFSALAERQVGPLRIIDSALLSGVSVVSRPAYGATTLEARAIPGAKIRASIPFNTSLTCDCHEGGCNVVSFAPQTFDAGIASRNVLAITGEFKSALAGTKTGGLTLTKAKDALQISVDEIADTAGARDLLEQISQGLIVARPVFIDGVFTEGADGVARYSSATLRAILFGVTDLLDWLPVKAEIRAAAIPPVVRRRRRWVL